ncbi:endonuclease MutS2 [Allofustis seminis]|uniref:endonuclease MutS2 n=1 Tax=Allofustis seminis TaxID=166939 RepID=UPI00037C2F5A|nr:endonuclease MutS2 [Allofustis seminis]
MEKIEEKTLRILEFPKVLKKLSEYALSDAAQNKILNLMPLIHADDIIYQQQATADALKILKSEGGIPLVRFPMLDSIFKRISIQATLSGKELATIGKLLSVSREVVAFFEMLSGKEIDVSAIKPLADELTILKMIENKIMNSVSDSGEVYDHASGQLATIRKNIIQTETTIRNYLEKITQGKNAKYLSDTLITMRNDRYVIPVQASYCTKFGGVVHDQSASGQTLFIEPQHVVELNNRLEELQSKERHEIARIFKELTADLLPHLAEVKNNYEILEMLDIYQAKAAYARDLKAIKPQINTENKMALYEARHPLISQAEVVANDIFLGKNFNQIIVTGPNTGGKTVVLKTIGLLQLMAQTGLHIPAAEGSAIQVYEHILADIGDEQSIEQNLSTFSSHMTAIINIMKIADHQSLVLFDELGVGTDPQEGAPLAMAILDTLMSRGTHVVTTSHYSELKAYGYNRPDTMNASMEFDVESLMPTYRFIMGIPGKSNALEIAKRLGLERSVIEMAKKGISHESQGIDEMIVDLNKRQKELIQSQEVTHRYLLEAEGLHRELKKVHADYLKTEAARQKQAKEKANKIVEVAEQKAERMLEKIRQMQLQSENNTIKEHELIDARSKFDTLKHFQHLLSKNKVLKKAKQAKELKEGQTVNVLSLNQQGVVVEKLDGKNWMVQMGAMKLKRPESDLESLGSATSSSEETTKTIVKAQTMRTKSELDIRGERVEDALYQLDQYIDQALLANLSIITIIHGVGTGAVRTAVRNLLSQHARIESFEYAPANQGGSGATIAKLK